MSKIKTKPKKIAFLFLIYDKINHEELWAEFFKQDDKDRHSIYIHYKYDKKLDYFENCKLKNCIETKWGDISLVQAQNLLLQQALKDTDNQHFIFCSGACIPLKDFDHVYNSLDEQYSYFNIQSDNTCFPRCNNALKYIKKKYIKKAAQWCILNRKHTEIILNSDVYIKWFKNTIGDEHCYVSYLYYMKLENELIITLNSAESATTFTNWPGMNYKYPSNAGIKNYERIRKNELKYLIASKCLFGRKFSATCDLSFLYNYIKSKNLKLTIQSVPNVKSTQSDEKLNLTIPIQSVPIPNGVPNVKSTQSDENLKLIIQSVPNVKSPQSNENLKTNHFDQNSKTKQSDQNLKTTQYYKNVKCYQNLKLNQHYQNLKSNQFNKNLKISLM
jgi:hypothetical protein